MSLGKNFRLPADVRPVRYSIHLAPDLQAGTFEGRMELAIRLSRPRGELQLHAVGLSVTRARIRPQRRAEISGDAESETVTFAFAEELPAGEAVLDLAWSGEFSPGLRGLYRAGPLAVTQFEAADARRVFPCFDEPGFKATWDITLLEVPAGLAAISNGRIVKDEADKATGKRTVQFATTPPLSSYLIAVCVG